MLKEFFVIYRLKKLIPLFVIIAMAATGIYGLIWLDRHSDKPSINRYTVYSALDCSIHCFDLPPVIIKLTEGRETYTFEGIEYHWSDVAPKLLDRFRARQERLLFIELSSSQSIQKILSIMKQAEECCEITHFYFLDSEPNRTILKAARD